MLLLWSAGLIMIYLVFFPEHNSLLPEENPKAFWFKGIINLGFSMMIWFIANMSCAQMSSSIAHVETSRTWPDLTGRVRFYAEERRRIPSRCTFAASLVKYCCLKLHSHRGRNPLLSFLHPVICCSRCIWMVEEEDWTLTQRKAITQRQQ